MEVSPPNKNEATFAQWIHEVREAQGRNSEATVRNWINRSLRGPPAELVRSMGSCASVAAILQAMEGKYGAVAPLDVMMKKLFSLSQGKTESMTNFAIRLESILANIQRDHPKTSDQDPDGYQPKEQILPRIEEDLQGLFEVPL